jgi:hypothetical protein
MSLLFAIVTNSSHSHPSLCALFTLQLPVEALPRRPLHTPPVTADQSNSTISALIEHVFSRAQSLEEGEIEETNVLEEGEILERYPTPNRVFLLTPAPSTVKSYTSTHVDTEGALSETYTPINNGDSEGFNRADSEEQALQWEDYAAEAERRYEAEQAIYEGLPEGEPFQLEFPPRNFTESLVQCLYFDPSYAGDLTTRFGRGFVYDTQFTVSDLLLFLDETPFPFSLPELFRPPIDRGESQRQTPSSDSLSSSSPSL